MRASLLAVAPRTEAVPSDPGVAPTYRPVQELRFTVHEYLKGSGPAEVIVIARGDATYLTEAEALQAATEGITSRNTSWDDRQGVLFLRSLPGSSPYRPSGASGRQASGGSSTPPAPALGFSLSNYGVQSDWDYAIDTLSRTWLPARDAGAAARASGGKGASDTQDFITDGSKSPPPVISLAGLRSKITEFEATLAAGESIAGFERCIAGKNKL